MMMMCMQIGGSDQMGNVYTGLDLIRKLGDGHEPSAFGLTFPLLTKADGTKMGKSTGGAVWLAAGEYRTSSLILSCVQLLFLIHTALCFLVCRVAIKLMWWKCMRKDRQQGGR
jgi:hypothetical protein